MRYAYLILAIAHSALAVFAISRIVHVLRQPIDEPCSDFTEPAKSIPPLPNVNEGV